MNVPTVSNSATEVIGKAAEVSNNDAEVNNNVTEVIRKAREVSNNVTEVNNMSRSMSKMS